MYTAIFAARRVLEEGKSSLPLVLYSVDAALLAWMKGGKRRPRGRIALL
jgi:hypothetical protein